MSTEDDKHLAWVCRLCGQTVELAQAADLRETRCPGCAKTGLQPRGKCGKCGADVGEGEAMIRHWVTHHTLEDLLELPAFQAAVAAAEDA